MDRRNKEVSESIRGALCARDFEMDIYTTEKLLEARRNPPAPASVEPAITVRPLTAADMLIFEDGQPTGITYNGRRYGLTTEEIQTSTAAPRPTASPKGCGKSAS